MERIWNYFFYSTWKLLISLGEAIIEKPLAYFYSLVPFIWRRWQKGKKEYKRVANNRDDGINISFAFLLMFYEAMIIYTSIFLYLVKWLGIVVGDTLYYYFIAVVVLSFTTNFFFLDWSDKYKKYFDEFDSCHIKNRKSNYLSAILFHLGVAIFGILSAYWTVGIDL